MKNIFRSGDILFGKLRPYFRKLARPAFAGMCSTDIWVVRARDGVDQRFLFYLMASEAFLAPVVRASEGTRMPRAKWGYAASLELPMPPPTEQRGIGRILGALDDRIELNRRMNRTLEAMARALFQSWFVDLDPVRAKMEDRDPGLPPHLADLFPDRLVDSELGEIPEGWQIVPLDRIARFQNGLALQKFRPLENEPRLPVVKIAHLRAGAATGGEWASAGIRPECVIDDGDIVFSWSGSLLVKIWCGGPAALNQHLFKVTWPGYPKWFVFQSLLAHLDRFRRIARDKATTMGHIRRHHLSEARCLVPPSRVLARIGQAFERWLDCRVRNQRSSRTLTALRDTLLPRLVAGELRLPPA